MKPEGALFENVAALLAKRHAGYLKRFKKCLTSAGYCLHTVEADACDYGVPQRRRRMLCFAVRGSFRPGLVDRALERFLRASPTVQEAIGDLPPPPVRPDKGCKPRQTTIQNHLAMQHSKAVKRKIAAIEPGGGPLSYRRLHPSRVAATVISGHRAPPAHYSESRSITVREAARLQGFPDDFEIRGTFANQMMHVTNAVPPPMGRAALTALAEAMEARDD
jgi:DNA (cytosine-5)-methyltransferase 1